MKGKMGRRAKSTPDSIKCPSCGELIPITETLHHQLTEQARAELREGILQEQKALAAKEKELKGREVRVLKAEQEVDQLVEDRLAAEKKRLSKEALTKAREEIAVELKDLKEQAAEKDQKLEEAQRKELELRKEKRELEAAKKEFELEAIRKLDAERQIIRDEATKAVLEEQRLKDAEKDRKLQDALKVNEELRQKLQQGSQQIQGEVLEDELEKFLRANSPLDEILPVPKGVRGADVLQCVRTNTGVACGSILWETKNAKNWSDAWIPKLKDDQREAKADIAVLVSEVLPKDITGFGLKEGVWLTSPRFVSGVLIALRRTLTEVAITKLQVASKNETVEALFHYLTGPEFRHRVEAIVRGFVSMKEDLDEEKRIAARRWAKREKQLELVIGNTSGMYGDLQGLIGTSMQPIPTLEAGKTEPLPGKQSEAGESSPDNDLPF